jgi:hypothetical protein
MSGDTTPEERTGLDRFLTLSLLLWGAITVVFVVGNAAFYAAAGGEVFDALVQKGPVSGLKVTWGAVSVVWLSSGIVVALLRHPGIRRRDGLLLIASFLALLLYASVLRERPVYPDASDYIRAAVDLHEGRPFHARFIYPPLLAAVAEPLVPLGQGTLKLALWLGNLCAVPLLLWLLCLTLQRYGFDRRAATVVALGFVALNVPILRGLVYGQVNLHVVNLTLIALLAYPRSPLASGLALALAVHLKASPLVLALPFVLEKSWRWTGAFLVGLVGVAGAIYALHGAVPFEAFVANTGNLMGWDRLAFREHSIESLLQNTAGLAGGPLGVAALPSVILVVKGLTLLMTLVTAGLAMRRAPFVVDPGPGRLVLNGWPALALLMVLASPLLWVHHGVFLALPFLVVATRLRGAAEWAVYSLAYGVTYFLPTFDFFPWSFARLGALFVLLALLYRVSTRTGDGDLGSWFREFVTPSP